MRNTIVEEWEKVKYSPAFVGLFYLSANHVKFKYSIKGCKWKTKCSIGLNLKEKYSLVVCL